MKDYVSRQERLEKVGYEVRHSAICADASGDYVPHESLYPIACAIAYKTQEKVQYYGYSKVINDRLKQWYVDGFQADCRALIAHNEHGNFDYFGALADATISNKKREQIKLSCTIKVMNKYKIKDIGLLKPEHFAQIEDKYNKAISALVAHARERLAMASVSDRMSDNADFINTAFLVLYENYLNDCMPFNITGYEYKTYAFKDSYIIDYVQNSGKVYVINGEQIHARLACKVWNTTENGMKVMLSAGDYCTLFVTEHGIISQRAVTPFLLASREVNKLINNSHLQSTREVDVSTIKNTYRSDNFDKWQRQIESDSFVESVMESLTEMQQCYLDAFLRGKSYAEIARQNNKSADTIRTTVNRIIAKLYNVAIDYIK